MGRPWLRTPHASQSRPRASRVTQGPPSSTRPCSTQGKGPGTSAHSIPAPGQEIEHHHGICLHGNATRARQDRRALILCRLHRADRASTPQTPRLCPATEHVPQPAVCRRTSQRSGGRERSPKPLSFGSSSTEYYQGEQGVLFGQVPPDDSHHLREPDKYDIGIEPGIVFFGDYWSPDGYFLLPVEPGTYRVDIHGSRWLADTSPVLVPPRRLVDVGTITLRRRDLSSLPRTRVRLNVRRASGPDKNLDAGGIRVRADMQDDNSFVAVTADDGTAEIDIPRLPGSWRVTSQERGYAQVWHSFFVEPESESVDLGRFEITRLKQVTIRWAMPKEPGSNRFAGDEVGGATTVLKAYGRCWAEGGSSEFTFAFDTKRPECGGRSDLRIDTVGRRRGSS